MRSSRPRCVGLVEPVDGGAFYCWSVSVGDDGSGEVVTWHHGLIARWWANFNLDGPEIDFFRPFVEAGHPALDAGCGTARCADGIDDVGGDVPSRGGLDEPHELVPFARETRNRIHADAGEVGRIAAHLICDEYDRFTPARDLRQPPRSR